MTSLISTILLVLGLSWKEHKTALDECQTMAMIVQRMVKEGAYIFETIMRSFP
jgi:hypothetical protein